jgi:cellulose synthase/poly-beta-1,6-N-acetylglucosamine synthase-like glycosyltransferase
MKLRRAGWRVCFAPDARGLTDVPTTLPALTAQRLRWDRGLITIWSRKFRAALDPRQSIFRLIDALAIADVVVFQIVLAVAFPIYVGWLLYYFGTFGLTIIGATLIAYSSGRS